MKVPALPSDTRPQLDQLTGLRGLAAWFVVFYHIRESMTALAPAPMIDVFAKGYLAVDLFFMLSGFVMWLSYGARFGEQGLRQTGPFLWKRFARIWPLHILALLGFVGFVVLLIATGRPIDGYPLYELPLHVLLVQNWGFTDALTWNHPAWSISTEFAAYLLFPLVAVAVRWEQLSVPSLLAILGLLIAGIWGWFALWGYSALGEDIARTGLMRCLLEFVMGMVLARLWQIMRRSRTGAAMPALAAILIGVISYVFGLPETLAFPALTATALLALALHQGVMTRALSSTPLVAVGDWSYATYLAHFLLFILFKIAFVGDDLQLGWPGLIAFCAITLAISAALFHLFEKPAQKWVNSRRPRALSPS